MASSRWRRVVLAIALFALTGTPAARAACAAACDPSAAQTEPVAPAGHAAHHHHHHDASAATASDGVAPMAAPCDERDVAGIAGTRPDDRSSVKAPPVTGVAAPARVRPPDARRLTAAVQHPRPPGTAASLPLRI